jgi:hypothetical protein
LHVENHAAVFQNGRLRMFGKKVFELAGQLRGGNFSSSDGHCDDDARPPRRSSSELLPASTLS